MQRLLSSAVWDTEGLAADLRDYVVEHLGDAQAVLVVDETGDVKKGTATVGVAPQYTGTAGRVVNAQVGVYLTYATRCGYAFLDRALDLPKRWTDDRDRCSAAGVPQDVAFATKPTLAGRLIQTAREAHVPASWVAGDEVYGADTALRAAIASAGLGFVLAVAKTHTVTTAVGRRRVADLAVRPDLAWNRMSAGTGTRGPRRFDWALIDAPDPGLTSNNGYTGILVRRTITAEKDLTFYRVHAPTPVPLRAFVDVAGTRWRIEEAFASAKELTGLDEHQVRSWTSWRRWTLLAMLAHAFLSVMALHATTDEGLVPLTRNEIRRLLTNALLSPVNSIVRYAWSWWRRRHQTIARGCHHRSARARPP